MRGILLAITCLVGLSVWANESEKSDLTLRTKVCSKNATVAMFHEEYEKVWHRFYSSVNEWLDDKFTPENAYKFINIVEDFNLGLAELTTGGLPNEIVQSFENFKKVSGELTECASELSALIKAVHKIDELDSATVNQVAVNGLVAIGLSLFGCDGQQFANTAVSQGVQGTIESRNTTAKIKSECKRWLEQFDCVRKRINKRKAELDEVVEETKRHQDELAAREKERQAALARQRLEARKKSDSAAKQIGKPNASTPRKDKSTDWSFGAVLGWGLVAASFAVIVYLVNRIRTMQKNNASEAQINASKKDARLKLTWAMCAFRCVAQAWKKFWKKRIEGVDAMPNGVEYFIVSVFLLALYVGWTELIDFQASVALGCCSFAEKLYRMINAILGNFGMKLLVAECMFACLFSLFVCQVMFAVPIVFLMGRIVRFNFRRLKATNRNRTQIVVFVILLLIMSCMPLLEFGPLLFFSLLDKVVSVLCFHFAFWKWGVVFCCGVWIIRLCQKVENG